jgi:archaemetzincin
MSADILGLSATVMALLLACQISSDSGDRLVSIKQWMEKIRPLHRRLGKPFPGDWLDQHHEPGQTFIQYVRSHPVLPTSHRRTIYVQPIGAFSPAQRRIIALTADFMGRYFALPAVVKQDLPLSMIPDRARRVHPHWGDRQILTTYVLKEILLPRLPRDAVAYIAFTASDLWPGPGWNFVFGQASLAERVGVWSIYRNGDPETGPESFRLCLMRTMKTATHETGHMFSMHHCTAYECNMCGSNHREEADRRPIACCPECVAKIWWATAADPVERYRSLAEFCKDHGFTAEHELYLSSIKALTPD